MIFLGAGASKALGLPTLQELSDNVFEELRNRGHGDIIERISYSMDEFDIKIDFESLYAIIHSLQTPIESVKKAGPFTAYLMGSKGSLPPKTDFSNLLRDMKTLLYRECYLGREKTRDIVNLYDTLFKAVNDQSLYSRYLFDGSNYSIQLLHRVISTTNYDMALELYFLYKGINYVDGYGRRLGESDLIKFFQWNLLFNPFNISNTNHILLKLHGSIWQFEQNNKLIKTTMDPNQTPIEIPDVGEAMMIYPTKEKEILDWKYYHFFNAFKKIEWDRILIIGYSFRDEPINTAILEKMKQNDQARMIVLNPSIDEVLKNVEEEIPEDRILKIRQKFGSKAGNQALQELKLRAPSFWTE